MSRLELCLMLGAVAALALGVAIGETVFTGRDWAEAFGQPGSAPAEVLWQVRAPRSVCAFLVGAALAVSGAVLQGLLRNPLADPGVLGVSASAALGGALALILGAGAAPGVIELAALAGAGLAGGALVAVAARTRSPETLILFGVALSAFAGALTALVFNLSPSPIAAAEVMNWLMGSVQNRSWIDAAWVAPVVVVVVLLARASAPGLRQLSLGEEAAEMSGLSMRRMRLMAVLAAALAAGAATAVAGVIGFVGLAAPHLVRAAVRGDPGRLLIPSALAGGLMLTLADVLARTMPTDQELKLGVLSALVGAPLFALIAWRAAREWRL
ncbi:FecCD family ABC transporter permease [Brevundimonas lutea]|uniref:FecCD family ABC transporter permease n=1 Tax=Brevundimonas lutea TaxID=2293980 RepID=UPI000F03E963|nr:iron ABC transporter permease [Brevundimonas lutea]